MIVTPLQSAWRFSRNELSWKTGAVHPILSQFEERQPELAIARLPLPRGGKARLGGDVHEIGGGTPLPARSSSAFEREDCWLSDSRDARLVNRRVLCPWPLGGHGSALPRANVTLEFAGFQP
jgi:hypothetical protein